MLRSRACAAPQMVGPGSAIRPAMGKDADSHGKCEPQPRGDVCCRESSRATKKPSCGKSSKATAAAWLKARPPRGSKQGQHEAAAWQTSQPPHGRRASAALAAAWPEAAASPQRWKRAKYRSCSSTARSRQHARWAGAAAHAQRRIQRCSTYRRPRFGVSPGHGEDADDHGKYEQQHAREHVEAVAHHQKRDPSSL